MKRAAIYARYSSSSQNEQSIDTQIDICKDYSIKHEMVVVSTYIDKGLTGTNTKRPGFQKMIQDSFKNKFDYVIVYKLDRFARDEYDDIHYERLLQDNGVKRVSATESIPDDYMSGSLIKAVTRWNNEQYSRLLSERVTHGLDKNVERGLMVGGSVTWGYRMINKKYVIDENTSAYVRMIFELYKNGMTAKNIASHLNSKGIYNTFNKPFSFQHILKILHNQRYIGIFSYKGKEYHDFLPSIIEKDMFYLVQSKLGKNAVKKGRIRANVEYLLTGKLFCGICGNKMKGSSGTGRHGGKFYYYRCTNPSCIKKIERKQELEKEVAMVAIENVMKNPELDVWIENAIEVYKKSTQDTELIVDDIRSQIKKTKNEIENVMKAIKMGIITSSTKSEIESLELKLNNLQIEETKKKSEAPSELDYYAIKRYFYQFKKRSPSEYEIKDIINELISKVVVTDNDIKTSFIIIGSDEIITQRGLSTLTASPPKF